MGSSSHATLSWRRRRCCSWNRSFSRSSVFGRQPLSRKQRFVEAELAQIADAHRVEDAVKMVDLVLHHARVEAFHLALEAPTALIEAAVAKPLPAWHPAAHAGNGEAAFPALLDLAAHRLEARIDEHGVGHFLNPGIARVGAHAEDHHPLEDADLRRGEPGAGEVRHGVAHIGEQRFQLRGIETGQLDRALEQAWIAHTKNFADHAHSLATMRRTRAIASLSTAAMRSSGTARSLSPRPAA